MMMALGPLPVMTIAKGPGVGGCGEGTLLIPPASMIPAASPAAPIAVAGVKPAARWPSCIVRSRFIGSLRISVTLATCA